MQVMYKVHGIDRLCVSGIRDISERSEMAPTVIALPEALHHAGSQGIDAGADGEALAKQTQVSQAMPLSGPLRKHQGPSWNGTVPSTDEQYIQRPGKQSAFTHTLPLFIPSRPQAFHLPFPLCLRSC